MALLINDTNLALGNHQNSLSNQKRRRNEHCSGPALILVAMMQPFYIEPLRDFRHSKIFPSGGS